MNRRRVHDVPFCSTLFFLTLTLAIAGTVVAQEPPVPSGEYGAAIEPTMAGTLPDRSDLGNVAQAARFSYDSGVRELSKALKLMVKAADATDTKEKAKTEKKALAALESAHTAFREAISYNTGYQQAYAGLGTVLLLQGKAEDALQVHAAALQRDPLDMENFQGWTEALLALNMLGNATSAYTEYAQSNPARAEILMTEIKDWLAVKQTEPGDMDPADIQRLADWVSQQSQS